MSDGYVHAAEDGDEGRIDCCGSSTWSDDDGAPVGRMADSRKRKKGDGQRKPRRKPVLRDDWRDLVGDMIRIPVSMMRGISKREVYTQLVLAIRHQLGTKLRRARSSSAGQELQDNDERMEVGDGDITEVGRVVRESSGVHAKCNMNEQSVRRVILDPGSTHSLDEEACAVRLGLRESRVQLPGIELASGQREPVRALGAPIRVSVEGVSAELTGRCVNARGSYDVLLGQDWLYRTCSTTDFGAGTYTLGGGRVLVR